MATTTDPVLTGQQFRVQVIVTSADGRRHGEQVGATVDLGDEAECWEDYGFDDAAGFIAEAVLAPAVAACCQRVAQEITAASA